MTRTLSDESTEDIFRRVEEANVRFSRLYPGEPSGRQAVHTVYGGAQLFKKDLAGKLGKGALKSLEAYAPDAASFAKALDLTLREDQAETLYARIIEKLKREPVEDFRIDYEDGYGNRPDEEEDGHAVEGAKQLAAGMKEGTLPPFIGIRIKPFTEELRQRSLRTFDLFLSTLVAETGGVLPENFVVTLPKVTIPEQVTAMSDLCDLFEKKLELPAGVLKYEIMIETTQAIFGPAGKTALPSLLEATRGRCVSAHFGTYDYTASCNITAAYQIMDHPNCDFARHMMNIAFAQTGITLSDGATNIMPVPIHRGDALSTEQLDANKKTVHSAWKLHYDHVRHSLLHAFYQGWDLHPAQLPTRYAAVYSFFLESAEAAGERLKNFVGKAAQATLVGEVFDDAATGQGLLNFFLRGVTCGAIPEEDALATGLTLEELRGRSFVQILKNRRGNG